MDMPGGDYYGGYPPPPGPHHPPSDPQYPQQQPPYNPYPTDPLPPPPPPFNGPPLDPNFNYHQPPPPPPPAVNAPCDSYGGGGGFWPSGNNGGSNYGGGGGAGGYSAPFHGRKRPRHASQHGDGTGYPKIYVASVPRTATEEDIRPVFEPHGRLVEVILLRDKRTGQQQGSCFVKYATTEEADRAIRALNDKFTFEGELSPVKVRYADGERERLGLLKNCPGGQWAGSPPAAANGDQWAGPPPAAANGDNFGSQWTAPPPGFKGDNHGLLVDKVYVSGVNRHATKQEIKEIFSPYGVVEDIFIIRDEMKQSRGCAFVKYSHSDMAVAAIKSLNGTFIMRGCDLPLTVRFAEPKKPRGGEPRGNNSSSGSYFSAHSREPVNRHAPHLSNSMGGFIPPVPSHHMQQQFNSSFPNQVPADHRIMPQPVPPLQQTPPLLPQCSTPHVETLEGSQTPDQVGSEIRPQPDKLQASNQKSEQQQQQQQQSSQASEQMDKFMTAQAQVGPQTAVSACTTSTDAEAASLECDWSQHICPDGFKYYYNCVTCESMWEKPDEFARYEQEQEKLRNRQNSTQHIHSQSPIISSTVETAQAQHVQIQNSFFPQEKGLAVVPACG
ncbi:flowering time control protein FCA-like isoform X2 [Punica granatum]|uniref:Flowering time control protein FCA-like isoform X2 n=1 Tax=Punica granatum TaxID=22663 RepID=A0A6P8E5A7_PUNGR|nr:flowering time control protein FCA-like isoform X2 [Punica granatum]